MGRRSKAQRRSKASRRQERRVAELERRMRLLTREVIHAVIAILDDRDPDGDRRRR